MLRIATTTTFLLAALALAGCASPDKGHDHGSADTGKGGMMMDHMAMMKGKIAFASLTPTQGNNVRGLVVFHEMDGHLMVHAKVSGLKPGAEHGIHVHEKGDCASADGTSAGGHFNPDGKPHGPQNAAHHAGDMPALKADANGVADAKFMLHGVSLSGGPSDIANRAVIVHANPDDYKTQPTGNSGARVACGVVVKHP